MAKVFLNMKKDATYFIDIKQSKKCVAKPVKSMYDALRMGIGLNMPFIYF